MKNDEEKVIDEIVKEVINYQRELEYEMSHIYITKDGMSKVDDKLENKIYVVYEVLERINKVSKMVKHNLNKRPYVKVHNLKIKPQYFKDVLAEKKRFEVRYNDRNFKVGDIIVLEEINDKGYTGKYVNTEITYILMMSTIAKVVTSF